MGRRDAYEDEDDEEEEKGVNDVECMSSDNRMDFTPKNPMIDMST